MPNISIILPSFNRADVLARSLASVARQTCKDWELILVDDGSTDSTESVIRQSHIPVQYIRTPHRGASCARNTGIMAGKGDYVAFLDSDDAWDPCYLSLCARFLDSNTDAAMVSTAVVQDFGGGHTLVHPAIRVDKWYPGIARLIGSKAFDLPPGETDPYMRIFSQREDGTEYFPVDQCSKSNVRLYHGDVFNHLRWGYLFSIVATVFRRSAINQAGLFDESLPSGEDFLFLARLCRLYPMNFFDWPGLIKHEFDDHGRATREGHLATSGTRMVEFQINLLRCFDMLFGFSVAHDPELEHLRGYMLFTIADHALRLGDTQRARFYFGEAVAAFPSFRRARWMRSLANAFPRSTALLYGPAENMLSAGTRAIRGNVDLRRAIVRLFSTTTARRHEHRGGTPVTDHEGS